MLKLNFFYAIRPNTPSSLMSYFLSYNPPVKQPTDPKKVSDGSGQEARYIYIYIFEKKIFFFFAIIQTY